MSRSMRQDLDAAMVGVVLDEHGRAAILEAMKKGEKPMKKVIRPMVVLAAVIAALTISALAFSPAVQEMLFGALGKSAPYAQTIEGTSAVDNGIEISVVSAITDTSATKVYLAVKDLKGDRLAGGALNIGGMLSRPDTQENGAWSGGREFLSYDAESRTALFVLSHEGAPTGTAVSEVGVSISQIAPGYHSFNGIMLPQELLTDKMLDTMMLDTGEMVLRPGQTKYSFKDVDYMRLSSMGFATDGKLHILLEANENADIQTILTNLWCTDEGDEFNDGLARVEFQFNQKPYYEITFPLTPKSLSRLQLTEIYGTIVDRPAIEGEWKFKVKLEQLPYRQYEINEKINSLTERTLFLSPLSIIMTGDPGKEKKGGSLQASALVAVWLKDGSILYPKNNGSMWSGEADGDRAIDRWEFKEPVDIEQIVGVSVWYWYIPINGDTAGPGYWLDKLPE